jgi:hypothetical protein
MVLRGSRNFVLATFGAPGHAMNGERSATPYQFWFVPRCVPAMLAPLSLPRLSSEATTPRLEKENVRGKNLKCQQAPYTLRALLRDQYRRDHAAASCRDHFIPHMVEADQLWRRARIEVAVDGITDAIVQLEHRLCLGENRLSDGMSRIAAFRRLFHDKNDLDHASLQLLRSCHDDGLGARPAEARGRERPT